MKSGDPKHRDFGEKPTKQPVAWSGLRKVRPRCFDTFGPGSGPDQEAEKRSLMKFFESWQFLLRRSLASGGRRTRVKRTMF